MSKAFKCDRCKKCFDPWGSEEEDFEFGQIRDYSVITPVGGSFDYTYRDEELHLCPKCNLEFARFMKNQCVVGGLPIFTDLFSEIDKLKLENKAFRAENDTLIAMNKVLSDRLSRKNCTADNEKDGV